MSEKKSNVEDGPMSKMEFMSLMAKAGISWDGNGGVRKTLDKSDCDRDTDIELLKDKIHRLEDDNKTKDQTISKTIYGSILGFVSLLVVAGINYGGLQTDVSNAVSSLQRIETRVDRNDNQASKTAEWVENNFTREAAFQVYKEATNVEIIDRKNYSVRNQERIERVSDALNSHIAEGHK